MRFSQSFIHTYKESAKQAESASMDLALRAGLIQQVVAGHYSLLPLGAKVLRNIQQVIREELERAGAAEVLLPIMQPASLWQESGRWDIYGQEMYKLTDRSERQFCLGPTHEELIVSLVKPRLNSYKQLPFTLFQFGTKFRDELRPRGGLLRAKEFLMKDAYSFDATDASAKASYSAMRAAYVRIFERLQINALPIKANTGEIGGAFSEEFIAPAAAGEDKFVVAADGTPHKLEDWSGPLAAEQIQTGIEIGHIFQLGTRYSAAMQLTFKDLDGHDTPVIMGCYGIGVSRMLATLIEQHHDSAGIIWPQQVSPCAASIIPIRYSDAAVREIADHLYAQLRASGVDVLLDDRDVSPGTKFNDSALLGVPLKLIVGGQTLQAGTVELEWRSGEKEVIAAEQLVRHVSDCTAL